MGNFNINVDRPKLTTDDINSKQNFDEVLSKYKTTYVPVYKNPWFWGSMGMASVGIATIVSLNLISSQVRKPEKLSSNSFLPPDTECIKPPVKGEDVPFKTFAVNVDKEEKIVLESGTIVTIPEHALKAPDQDKKVEIQIREFRDKASSFVAGIPMDYEKNAAFESAGMIELRGTQDHKEVKINEHKPIQVEFTCTQHPEAFDFWYLNEKGSRWEKYPATIPNNSQVLSSEVKTTTSANKVKLQSQIEEVKQKVELVDKKIGQLEKPMKESYKIPDESHQRFDLAFDKKEYPELAKFESLVFEVVPLNGYDKSFTSKNWMDVELLKDHSKYVMHFKNQREEFKIEVRPVLEGKELNKAKKEFDVAIETYTTSKKELELEKKTLEKQQKENEQRLAELFRNEFEKTESARDAANSSEQQVNKRYNELQTVLTFSNTISFQTTRWGVFNADRPISYPEPLKNEIAFTWKGSFDAKFKEIIVFNLDKNNRYVYGSFLQPLSNFGLHRKDDLVIIGIDQEGNLGYHELKNRSGQENFSRMEFVRKPKTEKSLDLLKKLLNETTEAA